MTRRSPIEIETTPLVDRPILPPARATGARNINGPCLIRPPKWVSDPLGEYYLYFADHKGAGIELAYADALEGPWTIHDPGVSNLHATPFLRERPPIPDTVDRDALAEKRAPGVPSVLDDCVIPHIASPDVVADDATRTLRLYYHGLEAFGLQPTRVAISADGLHFEPMDEILAPPYLRMFHYRGSWYGLAMPGRFVRSEDGISAFEAGPLLFEPDMRHAGVWLRGDTLWVFWTRVGDAPERILLSTIDLRRDWMEWRESEAIEVRRPVRDWEGAFESLAPSVRSSVNHPVNQLRDPYLFTRGEEAFLVYAVAGESGIAIARVETSES